MENSVLISAKITDKNQAAAAASSADAAMVSAAVSAAQKSAVSAASSSAVSAAQKSADAMLHDRFKQYGKNAREWTRKCALLLPEIAKREIWRKHGFENIYEYARILAGMSSASVSDALWVGRKIEDKPALKRVAEEKGINAIKPVVSIATVETENFWANKVQEMAKNTLEAYVREFKKVYPEAKNNNDFLPRKFSVHSQNLFSEINLRRIEMHINPEIAEKLQKLKGQNEWNDLMEKFIKLYEEKLESEKPELVKSAKRHIPAAIERYVLAKTGGSCAFPNCSKPYKILHHTDRFALSHTHDPDKLVPLCCAHERLVHLGLIENEEAAPERWRVRIAAERRITYENSAKHKIDQKVLKFRRAPE